MLKTMVTNTTAEALLHDLVAIPSLSGQEQAAVGYLVDWMAQQGYDQAFVDAAGNAVGIIGAGSREVMLLGHIDTFVGHPTVRLEGRTLYGRGTVDAKGSLCSLVVAALRTQLPPDTRLVVVGAVEEEAASSKGAHYIAYHYRPDVCIVGEPSQWDRITLGYKGRLLVDWRWQGGLAHSAANVSSPPEHAIAYWQQVQAYAAAFNADKPQVFERIDVTLQAINSGRAGVEGWATMTIGFRLPPNLDPAQVAIDIATPYTRTYGHTPALVAERDSSLSRVLRGAIRANGGMPRFVYKTGTADMNIVGPLWGCPIVAYGPGDSTLDHTPHEHLDLDEYLRAIEVLSTALSQEQLLCR